MTNYYHHYSNALDELHSRVTPEQFHYLLSVLSSDESIPSETCSLTLDTDNSLQGTSTWSNSDLLQPCSKEEKLLDKRGRVWKNEDGYQQEPSKLQFHQTEREQLGTFSSNRLVLPLSKLSRRPNVLKLSSFDSTVTSTNIGEENSSISRYGVTSKDSVLTLSGLVAVKENLAENIQLVQRKYAEVPLPLIAFQESLGIKKNDDEKVTHSTHKSCSDLPMCKKIMGKYAVPLGRKSRSSSVECVKAESLPDLDNPMLEIAGKIANEPVNPFPVLKNIPFKKHRRMDITASSKRSAGGSYRQNITLDGFRIEQGIDRELDMFQDYKNVSQFFSQGEISQNKTKKPATVSGGASRLSKRVTNPLYKEYDPAGYQKSEDELAFECIQMICDDFNKWIKSLETSKKKSDANCDHEDVDDEQEGWDKSEEETLIIGPEFLVQILRKELELPEKY